MATKVIDCDISTMPECLRIDNYDRALILFWQGEMPLGVRELPAPGGYLDRGLLQECFRELATQQPLAHQGAFERPPAIAGPKPLLSVIVCTRNRPEQLAGCIENLLGQSYENREIIIVDNGPENTRTREVVDKFGNRCRYVVEPRPGLRFARNRGIAVAVGEAMAFTDDDCRPVKGWLAEFVRHFAAEPETGCVTGPVVPLALESPAQELLERRGVFNSCASSAASFSAPPPSGAISTPSCTNKLKNNEAKNRT